MGCSYSSPILSEQLLKTLAHCCSIYSTMEAIQMIVVIIVNLHTGDFVLIVDIFSLPMPCACILNKRTAHC